MSTLLVGNFGDKNLGDELILLSALQDYPGAIVMTSNVLASQAFSEKTFETVPFPPAGLRSWLRFFPDKSYRSQIVKLRNCDIKILVFPGGGLFAIHWRACLLWWQVFLWCRWLCPTATIRFEHQGVDQRLGWLSRQLVKYVFRKSESVSVRDESSQAALEKIQNLKPKIQNDRVEEYLRNMGYGVRSMGESIEDKEPLVIVNAIKPFDVSQVEAKYPEHKIVFMPFSESDLSVLPDDFPHEVVFPQTKTDLFAWLSRAEIVIGERFHSLVCGVHFCGPEQTFLLRESYSEKVASFAHKHSIKEL